MGGGLGCVVEVGMGMCGWGAGMVVVGGGSGGTEAVSALACVDAKLK